MNSAVVKIKKGQGRSLKAGGPWIYDNEIDSISGEYENGDIVEVHDFDDYFLGYGFINTKSKITVRIMARHKDNVINDAFIHMRVQNAWDYRKETIDTSSCRVIFGEADFLPGIVIDKFADVLVVESLALGIDRLKPVILRALYEILMNDGIRVRGIYERSDAKVREQEGMERSKGFIAIPGMSCTAFRPTEKEYFDTNVEITENGVKYMVDVQDGQKTGFFLDQ
jgi:23S rRNA (cytosine1962-C5)-methyltransferase